MRLIRVEITADDIRAGEPRNCLDCAGARGLRRALPGAHVAVFGGHYVVNGRPYPSPPTLKRFVSLYDERGLMPDAARVGALTVELQVEDGVAVAEWAEVREAA